MSLRRNDLVKFILPGFFLLLILACETEEGSNRSFLNIKADGAWKQYSTVRIVTLQMDSVPLDTLFNDSLESESQLGKLDAPHYHGQKIRILIQGYEGDKLVFQETFVYDGSSRASSDKIVTLFPPDTLPDTTHPDTTHPDTTHPDTTGPKPHSLTLDARNLIMYWNQDPVALLPQPASEWKGFHPTWTSGNTRVATVSEQGVVTTVDSGAAVITASAFGYSDSCAVRVIRDVPMVDAGPEADAIQSGASREFTLKASQSYGKFTKLAWDWNGDGILDDSVTTFTSSEDKAVTRSAGTHQYKDTGKVTLHFYAWDGEGNRGEAKKILTVTDKPIPTISSLQAGKALVSIKDTVSFSAHVGVASGTLKEYSWDYDNDTAMEETHSLAGKDSADVTGKHVFDSEGTFNATLYLTDTLGTRISRGVAIEVRLDPPVFSVGADTTVTVNTVAHLHGFAQDSMGSIAKREWQIGRDAPFVEAAADYDYTPTRTGAFDCTFRATDDDGNARDKKMTLTVENPGIAADQGVMGYALVDAPGDYNSVPDPGGAKIFTGRYFNSTGLKMWLTHMATGRYEVEFQHLIGPPHQLANVQVVSYGGADNKGDYCKADSNSRGEDADILISCYSATGSRKDGGFYVWAAYGRNAATGPNAGVIVEDGAAFSAPKIVDSSRFSSSGGDITVKRGANAGMYDLVFKGMKDSRGAGGTLQVTSYGRNPDRCQIYDWQDNGNDVQATVFCGKYDKTGEKGGFSAALLWPPKAGPNLAYGYAYISEPFPKTDGVSHALLPSDYDRLEENGGAPIDAKANAGKEGDYTITFPGLAGRLDGRPGMIMVSSQGEDGISCRVYSSALQGSDMSATVHCYNPKDNTRSNSAFTILMVR
jgi:hypothetical protein